MKSLICPGCGGRFHPAGMAGKPCPHCGWENNLPPYRLLNLRELLNDSEGVYNDIRMDKFLRAVLQESYGSKFDNATRTDSFGGGDGCQKIQGEK
jgi:hypothetical protein